MSKMLEDEASPRKFTGSVIGSMVGSVVGSVLGLIGSLASIQENPLGVVAGGWEWLRVTIWEY